ncbi:glycoside hydrolase family 31 protein [Pseudomassariella vexata]|uniref:alpha-D-xyloside xylohydrolase n=1 Tax=Pseudomassariella vexata TaxID=1141098 RepID=A0A1Y2DRN6_9PEZI|nr:glycoside hydrolase family 31 protein [Pseudomassariella vexata]ORY61345.1 glycoside hydrolase family 31 protein [Pseudomassariella vexata]
MKFRDGMWLVAEGMRVEYAEDVHEITPTENGLSLLCPTRHIRSRGDVLNLSTIKLDIEAAFDGVISVEATHWSGAVNRGPHFDLYPNGRPKVEAKVTKGHKGTTLNSGSLSATIHPDRHNFDIRFHSTDDSKQLTSLLGRSVGLAYNPAPSNPRQTGDMRDFKHYIFTQTTLSVGESVHGLGERFGPFNKVGQNVSMWNADGGTSSDQAYKNVSFWLSSRGYGVFVDTAGKAELEIGSERTTRVQTSIEGQRLKWYIIYGKTPKEVLQRYSVLTGKPGKVPSWSFGLWLSTSFTTNYDEDTVKSFLEGMKERDTQVDVFHYDCYWMKAFTWTDFVFDAERFPDPKGQIARLKSSGLVNKVCVWINPYIAQHGAVFETAAKNGYLLKRKNGDIWQWDLWHAGMALVDFTNPAAVDWYVGCLNGLFEQGVDAIKTDFGERIPTLDVEWFDKSIDPHKMHNYYAFIYNKIVYEALQKRYGPDQAVLFARSACAGTQRFPLQWGGDCESTPEAMAESVRGGLSLGLSGFAFWSVDIGGFEGYPAPWIYKRWVAFGLLCSHSRLHGSSSYRVPWTIDDDDRSDEGCSATLAKWTSLKTRLMPYLFAQAAEAIEMGVPLSLRAMCLEFPDDPTSWYLDRQFMVGDRLLAAPVFEESGEVEFYLPKGKWTSFFTNQTRDGPGWFKERHGFGSLPLYVRENTVLVLGKEGVRGASYNYAEDVEVCLYQAKEGARSEVVDRDWNVLGALTVGADGELKGSEILKGKWVKSGEGRKIEEVFMKTIEWL